jgi:ankyrin repeat protein
MSVEKLNSLFFKAARGEPSVEDGMKYIELCLKAGIVDVNLEDEKGYTALMFASEKSLEPIVKLLIASGANVNLQGKEDGMSALMFAARYPSEKTVKLLLDAGADVNQKDIRGTTALMHASWRFNFNVVKLLVDAGTNVNHQCTEGWTALMSAVNKSEKENVKILLDAGADINLKNNCGKTALGFADCCKSETILQMLVEAQQKQSPIKLSPFKVLSTKVQLDNGLIFEGTMVDDNPSDGVLTYPDGKSISVSYEDGKFFLKL